MTDGIPHALAPRIVPVLLANLTTRYPYYDAHVMQNGDAPRDPTVVHPAFGNSFDWHSSVHSHWTAVQLVDHYAGSHSPPPVDLDALRASLHRNLHPEHVALETAYLAAHPSYERPYGWAWALMLAAAAASSRDAWIRERAATLRGMAEQIATNALLWLDVLSEPVRHGVHGNTAFALGLMLDSAPVLGLDVLAAVAKTRAREWFYGDRDWPQRWERSGTDFLSPGLAEADLMRRILTREDFAAWWRAFLPGTSSNSRIFATVAVPDVDDGQIVHLHGLNLSRAGMLARIATTLENAALAQRALRLYRAGVEHALSGGYLSTHWLATYAWDAAVSCSQRPHA